MESTVVINVVVACVQGHKGVFKLLDKRDTSKARHIGQLW